MVTVTGNTEGGEKMGTFLKWEGLGPEILEWAGRLHELRRADGAIFLQLFLTVQNTLQIFSRFRGGSQGLAIQGAGLAIFGMEG